MNGIVHYSKHGHLQIVGEDTRVYYTGITIMDSKLANRTRVAFEIVDKMLSIAKIINC
jgi:hypothetical protein